MSSPARRPGNRPSRRQRESRAFTLTVATGGFALATVVAFVLALVGVLVGFGTVVLLAIVTVILGLLLRSSLR